VPEEQPSRSLEEIFGVDLWSEQPTEDGTDPTEERRREREYEENRPPHHEER
jgi:hypothetical protein